MSLERTSQAAIEIRKHQEFFEFLIGNIQFNTPNSREKIKLIDHAQYWEGDCSLVEFAKGLRNIFVYKRIKIDFPKNDPKKIAEKLSGKTNLIDSILNQNNQEIIEIWYDKQDQGIQADRRARIREPIDGKSKVEEESLRIQEQEERLRVQEQEEERLRVQEAEATNKINKIKPLLEEYKKHLEKDMPSANPLLEKNKEKFKSWQEKFNLVNQWLKLLNNPEQDNITRLKTFEAELSNKETQAKIAQHRDPRWQRVIRTILIAVGSLALGAGIIAATAHSKSTKGHFRFWESRGSSVVNQLKAMSPKPLS